MTHWKSSRDIPRKQGGTQIETSIVTLCCFEAQIFLQGQVKHENMTLNEYILKNMNRCPFIQKHPEDRKKPFLFRINCSNTIHRFQPRLKEL